MNASRDRRRPRHDSLTMRSALIDAIQWQESYAAVWSKGSPERREATNLAKRYRALLKKRFGESGLPMEAAFAEATLVSITDLPPPHPHDNRPNQGEDG